METRTKPRGTEGNTMNTVVGIYLYGIACIMCGVVLGVWLEGK